MKRLTAFHLSTCHGKNARSGTGLITEGEYFKAWFICWICSATGGFVAGGFFGMILGFALAAGGADRQTIRMVCSGAGLIAGAVVSYVVFRVVVAGMIVRQAAVRTEAIVLAQNAAGPPPPAWSDFAPQENGDG